MSLYQLLEKLGRYQDIVNRTNVREVEMVPFSTHEHFMSLATNEHLRRFEQLKAEIAQRAYFFNVVFPMVFVSIEASVLEYQTDREDLEMLTE